MDIDNPAHSLRLYNFLAAEQLRKKKEELRASKKDIGYGAFMTGTMALLVFATTDPRLAHLRTAANLPLTIGVILSPLLMTLGTAVYQHLPKRPSTALPAFHLAQGHVDAIVTTAATLRGYRSGGTKIEYHFVLSSANLMSVGPGGLLTYHRRSIRHMVSARSAYFYGQDFVPKAHTDLLFTCDPSWDFGTPLHFSRQNAQNSPHFL